MRVRWTWTLVERMGKLRGWRMSVHESKKKIFVRYGDRIIATKIIGGWKVEYFQYNRLVDSSGIVTSEQQVMILICEMFVVR